jgi:phosphoribosylformimino-5-aminoimidazole carboxamide ribotide isomerase
MILLPAIDLYSGQAVRLTKGDYAQMTVYSDKPAEVACSFRDSGATHLHVVDLEGARDGSTANFETIRDIVRTSGLFTEVGGGIRSRDVIQRYLDIGVERVILGTAAITQPGFVDEMVTFFGSQIAVGVDLKDGFVAVKGWTEVTALEGVEFCRSMEAKGVKTIICTDISKDGVLGGANNDLYRRLLDELSLNIIASGGVSSLKDILYLGYMGLHGAILGKALYEGKINLKEAVDATAEGCCGG